MIDVVSRQAATRDSLSNFAASLNAGQDKTTRDHFFIYDLTRAQVEAMYRGDWLARKVVDIVPYDMVREWREWSGARADIQAIEREERRLNYRKVLQRALTLGRLYGGAAIVIGTAEEDPAALARELDPAEIGRGGIAFLHAVTRWQLNAPAIDRDPMSPYFGEAVAYEVVAPTRGALHLHPSRVIRFLGNEWPDPSVGASVWSDSVLQTLYDAIHAVALTNAGATSLMHEAKVDVVTVPNLSEHLASSATTAQLSARFSYAAAMKSINNLLLLGDGETWSRQTIDFTGLPEMVRTFLQVAAGAADIPVTRLLGQSPAGLSATGDSDTRNYYDMIAARQAIDLRPKLERLDDLILRSAGVDQSQVSFDFRPLWQMDAATSATVALNKAQTTQIYAGLKLWPDAVTARLVQSQLMEDGTYPAAEAVFAAATPPSGIVADASEQQGGGASRAGRQDVADFDPNQPRDPWGRWTTTGQTPNAPARQVIAQPGATQSEETGQEAGGVSSQLGQYFSSILGALNPIGPAQAQAVPPELPPEVRSEVLPEEQARRILDPVEEVVREQRIERYAELRTAVRKADPSSPALETIEPPDYVPNEAEIARMEEALVVARQKRECLGPAVSELPASSENPIPPSPQYDPFGSNPAAASPRIPETINNRATEFGGEDDQARSELYYELIKILRKLDPDNPELANPEPGNLVPSTADVTRVNSAIEALRAANEPAVPSPNSPSSTPANPNISPLITIISPNERTIDVFGTTRTQRAKTYEQAIREYLGSENTKPSPLPDGGQPDDIINKTSIEVKYTDGFDGSLFNPARNLSFQPSFFKKLADQAERYSTALPGGVNYYTNNTDVAIVLTDLFQKRKIKNFRFFVVSTQRK